MKVYIETYGCQMNQYDSSVISFLVKEKGWELVEEWSEAEAILVNTCSVRAHAEHRVLSRLGVWGKYKREKNPSLLLGVMGCMAQKEGKALLERFAFLDLVVGTHRLWDLPALLERAKKERILATESTYQNFPLPKIAAGGVSAFISIMRGCNNFCSYCIVPYVRGRERSRPPEDILEEVKGLVKRGVKEITLLGQNVNSYRGVSLKNSITYDLPDLLKELNEVEGLYRIKFATSHPKDLSAKLIRAVKDCQKVCEYLHVPVQSGSNRILALMNRGYTREDYLNLAKNIRREIPEASITTDIIVGFPTEKEEDFLLTKELMEEIRFDTAYIFKYSPRPHTAAAKLPDDVPREEKEKRLGELLALQKRISQEKGEKLLGKELEVLIERKERDKWLGKTRTHRTVLVESKEKKPGGKDIAGKNLRK
ncbi:MAG: tRNA (N6-isopentenyl adenosine(37)-C2)-methylthiotransferase MiaB [Caldiserica bacterium]|nr:tRNA (N6-isopentenyl adenosine(37)-C2)-methylthiotransferase MiaB [Caldisericota bacterium]